MPPVPTVNDTLRTYVSIFMQHLQRFSKRTDTAGRLCILCVVGVYRRTFPSYSKSRRRKPAIVTGLPVSAIGKGIGAKTGPAHTSGRVIAVLTDIRPAVASRTPNDLTLREFRFIGFGRTLGNYARGRADAAYGSTGFRPRKYRIIDYSHRIPARPQTGPYRTDGLSINIKRTVPIRIGLAGNSARIQSARRSRRHVFIASSFCRFQKKPYVHKTFDEKKRKTAGNMGTNVLRVEINQIQSDKSVIKIMPF